jgi:hypothetical protein
MIVRGGSTEKRKHIVRKNIGDALSLSTTGKKD